MSFQGAWKVSGCVGVVDKFSAVVIEMNTVTK